MVQQPRDAHGRFTTLARRPPDTGNGRPPRQTEQTGPQRQKMQVGGLVLPESGFPQVPRSTIEIYRKMRANPNIALARMAATLPIRSAEWSFEAQDEQATRERDFIDTALSPLMPNLIDQTLRALEFGFQAFEKVFTVQQIDGSERLVYDKLKPLLPEMTEVRQDKETGQFRGVKQDKVELPPEKVFWYAHDQEGQNFFGRSRHENVKRIWSAWESVFDRMGAYSQLAAGPVPMIHYPLGESEDEHGDTEDNFEIAQAILQNLGNRRGVTMPDQLADYAQQLLAEGIDPSKLRAWKIDYLESRNQHGDEFTGMLSWLSTQLLRGWLVPERVATEGEHGTKAEAAVHVDLLFGEADALMSDIARCFNWWIIDPLLAFNFGEEAKGTVTWEPAPLVDRRAQMIRDILTGVFGDARNVDVLMDTLDVQSMLDQAGLPANENPESGNPGRSILPPDNAD